MKPDFFSRSLHSPGDSRQSEDPSYDRTVMAKPSLAAARALAVKWDQIIGQMNDLRTSADLHLAENIQLLEQLAATKRDAADRLALLTTELKRETERSEAYQTSALRLRLKFELMAESLIAALKQDFPDRRRTVGARDGSTKPGFPGRRRGDTTERHAASQTDERRNPMQEASDRRQPANADEKRPVFEEEFSRLLHSASPAAERRSMLENELPTDADVDVPEDDVSDIIEIINRLMPNGGLEERSDEKDGGRDSLDDLIRS
jgi:hypothetical protein